LALLVIAEYDAIALLRGDAEAKAKALPPKTPSVPKSFEDTAERRQVTMLFSDLVGSTALSARMDPEDCARSFRPIRSASPKP
jgi:class 3 adenylate cyclase